MLERASTFAKFGVEDEILRLPPSEEFPVQTSVAATVLNVRNDCGPAWPACQLSLGSKNRGSVCAATSPTLAIVEDLLMEGNLKAKRSPWIYWSQSVTEAHNVVVALAPLFSHWRLAFEAS